MKHINTLKKAETYSYGLDLNNLFWAMLGGFEQAPYSNRNKFQVQNQACASFSLPHSTEYGTSNNGNFTFLNGKNETRAIFLLSRLRTG